MAGRDYRLAQIVARLGGELVGDPRTSRCSRVATLERAEPGDIGFLAKSVHAAAAGRDARLGA